jgi:hypothetical protein
MLVPVPIPAFTPIDYWAAAFVVPVIVPTYLVRASLGGIGFALGEVGRSTAQQNGLLASGMLRHALGLAIADADARMDPCNGKIFIDLIGQSRGGAVITESLRKGLGSRSRFNTEVSTTLLDAVDASGPGEFLPWIRGGYIVSDPPITRVGSEWNSNFYGDRAQDDISFLETLLPLVPPFVGTDEFRRWRVIGLPKGRSDRQPELQDPARSFPGAY